MGSLGRRERRPLWIVLSLVSAVAIGLSIWAAIGARADAIRGASSDAELAARTELAPLLQARDMSTPVTGVRAQELADGIERTITSVSSIDDVRIFSSLGRILYASDPKFVGTRPSYLRDLTFEVSGGQPRSVVRQGVLQTYVPIWMNPGGDVAVAELSQPVGPIAADATATWVRIAVIAAIALLGCLAMAVVTSRAPAARTVPVQLYAPAVPRRTPPDQASADAPLYEHAGFREMEEQRQEAERRANVVEENFRAVQIRLKEAQAQVKELEERLAMNETQNTTNDGELHVLRDQLRETSERLHQAELDNNALRERMSLRQQELDEARRMLAEVRMQTGASDLRARLAAADDLAARMERQIDELGAELRHRSMKLVGRSAEPVDELDDELEIQEEDDDLFEHPVIIRNGPTHPTPSEWVR